MRQIEGEWAEALPEAVQGGEMKSMENDDFSVFETAATPVAKSEEGCDPVTRDVMEDRFWEASSETVTKVKDALEEVQECFDSFGHSLTG